MSYLMGPLDRIMHLIDFTSIHLVKVIHAAKDHIEKMLSAYFVHEVPIRLIRVIIYATNVLLEQQILKSVQMMLGFASYVP